MRRVWLSTLVLTVCALAASFLFTASSRVAAESKTVTAGGRAVTIRASEQMTGMLYLPVVGGGTGAIFIETPTATPTAVSTHTPTATPTATAVPPVVPDTTQVLSETILSLLTSPVGNSSVLTFTQLLTQPLDLAPGEVIVSAPSAAAPDGLLRKVEQVNTVNGQVVVETSSATLDEAIDQGEFALSREFSPADLHGVTMAEGVTMVQAAVMGPNNTFFFELNDVVLWDEDRNLSTTYDQVRANGSIELSPDVDFRWLKESGRAANFEFTVEQEQEVELELEARISRKLEPLRYQIARLNLGDYVTFVGVVPVYIKVVMPIYLRADGEVSAGMVMAVTQTLTVEAGVRRYNGEWQPIGDLDNRFTFEPPRPSLGGKVKGYIDPPLSLLLYDVGGPFAGANPFLELEADLFKTPWWELHAGIDVTVGVRGEILGRSLGEYTDAVIGYRVLLAQATTRPPTTPHSPSPADAATATSLAPTLSWQGGDPDGDAVTYTVRLGTANPPPPVAANQTQTTYSPATLVANTTYYWQIVAQDASGATTAGPIWRFTTAAPTPTATPTATSIPPTATPSPGSDTAEEILIPAGSFQMGCDSSNSAETCQGGEQPLHTVTLSAYYIDKYEVTNARYQACVDAGGCTAPQSVDSYTRSPYYGTSTYADYPVINVDWSQASAFCAWAGGRLPTEAEWEKAARGSSDTRKYPWGNSAPDCTKTNYRSCVGDTSRVGSYPSGASPYGVMDMGGNVIEWVNDWYSSNYYSVSPSNNPQGPATGRHRVLRGGSWLYYGNFVRSAYRLYGYYLYGPDFWDFGGGFRCVRSQ